jgi:enoyl-CoA hydratase/carnithine racemase
VTRIAEYGELTKQLTGEPSIAMLFRYLSASRLVTIAQIEGRVRGVGSEFVLACDMRFAALESAIFGQPEVGFGQIPGSGAVQHLTRLMGRGRACVESTFRFAAELGYEVTVVRDATADYSDKEMHAALDVDLPSYANAIMTTQEIVQSTSSLTPLEVGALR